MAVSSVKYDDCPEFLRNYLYYMLTIKGRSSNTVDGYYIDLKNFFRYIKAEKNNISYTELSEVSIKDISLNLVKQISLSDVYEYLNFVMAQKHNCAKTRARKVSSLRSFFKYMTVKVNLLSENPVRELEVPSLKKSLPKYLSLEESQNLLEHVDGNDRIRDYCILTLFLNCGLRLSELVGLNNTDIHLDQADSYIKVLGKGNKERQIYLNDSCVSAIKQYQAFKQENKVLCKDKNAFFISRNQNRISKRRVQEIVEANLKANGLYGYSTHKLRHTAATMLYQYGHVDIRILKELLGHANLATTEIYTHVSSEQLKNAVQLSPLSNKKAAKKVL